MLGFFALPAALASLADVVGEAVGEAVGSAEADALAALGTGHALPYAAGGSAWRLASAATDARVAAAVRADGWCAPGNIQAHTPSATTPAHRIKNRRRQKARSALRSHPSSRDPPWSSPDTSSSLSASIPMRTVCE